MEVFRNYKDYILAGLLFLLVLAVYVFTLAPTITMEDSGELVTAAATLGIPHPSGYPLWTILGQIFCWLPFGTVAWRVNLMSAVFGALTILVLYLIFRRTIKNQLAAFCAPLLLAFSATFWQQSVTAKFYTLNSFFVLLLIYVLLVWSEKREHKYLYFFSLLYGLSLTNHTMMLLLAPAYAAYIIWTEPRIILAYRLILKMFGLFLLGLAVYAYIPWRAFAQADFNWGQIVDWPGVIAHITRSQYGDFSPLAKSHSKTGLVISFLVEISLQFFTPTIFLALAGAIYLWLKNRALAALTTLIFLLNSLGIIYLRKFGMLTDIVYVYRVYYLPAFCVLIFWVGVILDYLYEFLKKLFAARRPLFFKAVGLAFGIILLLLPVCFLAVNYDRNNYRHFWLNYDYAKNLLASLEPDSIYFFLYDQSLQGDTELFSLLYLQLAENFRPDVLVVSEHNLFYKKADFIFPKRYYKMNIPRRQAMIYNLLKNSTTRPLYTNFAYPGLPPAAKAARPNPFLAAPQSIFLTMPFTLQEEATDFFTVCNGYAFRFFPSLALAQSAKRTEKVVPIRNAETADEFSDLPTRGLVAHYYYNLAFYHLTLNQPELSQSYLHRAVTIDPYRPSMEYWLYQAYRRQWPAGQ